MWVSHSIVNVLTFERDGLRGSGNCNSKKLHDK